MREIEKGRKREREQREKEMIYVQVMFGGNPPGGV